MTVVGSTKQAIGMSVVLAPIVFIYHGLRHLQVYDEIANFDGVDCGATLIRAQMPKTIFDALLPGSHNPWLDCQSCCRKKGYRGVIK